MGGLVLPEVTNQSEVHRTKATIVDPVRIMGALMVPEMIAARETLVTHRADIRSFLFRWKETSSS